MLPVEKIIAVIIGAEDLAPLDPAGHDVMQQALAVNTRRACHVLMPTSRQTSFNNWLHCVHGTFCWLAIRNSASTTWWGLVPTAPIIQ